MNNEAIISKLYAIVEDCAREARRRYEAAVVERKASLRPGDVVPASIPLADLPDCQAAVRAIRDEAEAKIDALRGEVYADVAGDMSKPLSEEDARALEMLLSRQAVSQEEVDAYALRYRHSCPFLAGLREVAERCGVKPPAPHASARTMDAFDRSAKRCKMLINAESALAGTGEMATLKADMANYFDGYCSFLGKRLEPFA